MLESFLWISMVFRTPSGDVIFHRNISSDCSTKRVEPIPPISAPRKYWMAPVRHSFRQAVQPQQSRTSRIFTLPSGPFVKRSPGQTARHLPHPAHLFCKIRTLIHLTSCDQFPVDYFCLPIRFSPGIDIFQPFFTLFRIICIFPEAVPSGFLSCL